MDQKKFREQYLGEFPPFRPEVYYVPNYGEACTIAKSKGWSKKEWKFIKDENDLRGIHFPTISHHLFVCWKISAQAKDAAGLP